MNRLPSVFLFVLLSGFLTRIHAQELTSGGPLKPEQAIMDVRHYTIALKVDIPNKSIDGNTVVDVILSQSSPVLLFDLLDSFHIHSITVNDVSEPYTYKDNLIRIQPAAPFPAGKLSVKVVYDGKPHIDRKSVV